MNEKRLHPKAWVVFVLNALYSVAQALCSVFVAVYFYVVSLDFNTVCYHYLALYIVTPVVFILAGWYSQARDRVHVYRIGLVLHAVYYATLLYLQEDAQHYAFALGALLGVTWGFFWAGNNTLQYDMSSGGKREYFFGLLHSIVGLSRLVAPLMSGFIIQYVPTKEFGYHLIFFVALLLYIISLAFSLLIPQDRERRKFHIRRALFPGKDQRDWRLIMLAAASQAGAFSIFNFLLGLVMYLQTGNEMDVGKFLALQAVAGIASAYLTGRFVNPTNRKTALRWGVILLVLGGTILLYKLNIYTLLLFGLMRAVAAPLYSIPQFAIRLDVIARSVQYPEQRIEYLSAWEVPLAIGRIVMMTALILLSSQLDDLGIRIILFLLCANRIVTYALVSQVSFVRENRPAS